MRFRAPGGDVTWLSVLFAIAGAFLAWSAFSSQSYVLGSVFTAYAVLAALLWTGWRWPALFLILMSCFVMLAMASSMFQNGFSLNTSLKFIMQLAIAITLWRWYQNQDDFSQPQIDIDQLRHR